MTYSVIEKQKINGVDLSFSINKQTNSNKPILLYLHGEPGDSCIPLTQKFNSELEKEFIFVNLEQRGSGLSYYKFSDSSKLSIEDIVNDIFVFINYLLKRFNQEKVILVGHSWGSVLAIKLIQNHPEIILKYIGIGQVINMKKNIEYQQSFLKEKGVAEKIINFEDEKALIADSLSLTRLIVKNGGSLYKQTNYSKLIFPFLFSKSYSLKSLIHRVKGSNQSIQYFWKELMDINFEEIDHFSIPIYFFEGRHDYHVSSEMVNEFSKKIKSSVSLVWFENSGHFPQWEESQKFNQCIIDICIHNDC
ncbi:alpha/beta fold hydrolase [Vagococcus hydrophili]|uniref:Alpha/beta hydrolase n=1 Tax=Vagococcus hydrophili TaxID=2714947 RepID=A0A6G8ASP7_9ENTE|nr:alpha/beta hydrolase [Vagococcus hydrophili]QIL47962.1 alpha/beta hydrolase [Vagococcus hydrophili]